MELHLEAFQPFLNNVSNLELINDKLFGILLLENGGLIKQNILEEDFEKYNHILLIDDYPNLLDIKSKVPHDATDYPIVVLK